MLLRPGRIVSWVHPAPQAALLLLPRPVHAWLRGFPAVATPSCSCRKQPIATWPTTVPTSGTGRKEQSGSAGSREHSVRRVKVANAVEQQLRLVLQHPADLISSGRPGSSASLEDITLQQVEVNGDLSVATVWWRLKDEEDAVAGDSGLHAGSAESARRLSRADLDAKRQAANRAIRSSTSWMRRRVGVALSLRKVPALRFRHASVVTSESTNGKRKTKRKTAHPEGRRVQRLEAAFSAIANERTYDQDSRS